MGAIDLCPRCGSNQKNVGSEKCNIVVGFHSWHVQSPPEVFKTGTHVAGPMNSTRFTNCCNVAVVERYGRFENCPVCLREVG